VLNHEHHLSRLSDPDRVRPAACGWSGLPILWLEHPADPSPRYLIADHDATPGVTLRKGVNVMVVKVVNWVAAWQACIRFTDKDGRIVTDLKVTLTPP
jgi:hypothetical protein